MSSHVTSIGCCRDFCGHHAGIDPLHGVVPVWLERLRAGRREIEAMTRAGTFEFYERYLRRSIYGFKKKELQLCRLVFQRH